MATPHWNTLVTVSSLHHHLHDAQLVIVDCRFELGNCDPDAGRHAYQRAHLPGAQYAHLNDDLSGPITPTSGRHPLPEIQALCATLGKWGIDHTKQVVVYAADNSAIAATRLWWLLRWLGHERVAVLDGGLKRWQSSGLELTNALFTPATLTFVANLQTDLLVDAGTVAAQATQTDWRVLDARAPERYAGEVEPLDAIAGHVPSARNHPFNRNLDADGNFLPADQLRAQFDKLIGPVNPSQVINMCGSGVTACHNLLAMELAGLEGTRLYAGSWSEWSKQQRPVATGQQP
jgi:thiosulfate/3-mercaptopyruvate sulfurtransferase